MTLKATVLAAAMTTPLMLLAAVDYEPQTLTLIFADGHQETVAATSPATCELAVRALVIGNWRPLGEQPVAASCGRGDRFDDCSRYIVGFNAPARCGMSGSSRP